MKNQDDDRSNFFSLFTGSGLDKLFHVVADMVENEKDEVHINGDIKPDNHKKVIGKYGVNIKLGPDKLDGFSSMKFDDKMFKKDDGPKIVVPSTDVFEEDDRVIIVSELPGVERDNIKLNLDKNTVTFTAQKKDICYTKQLELNFAPEYDSIDEIFKNSIYSVTIKKKKNYS